MSSQTPPNPWFNPIDFNPNFFTTAGGYATITYVNGNFLRSTGAQATSIATLTSFNGQVEFNYLGSPPHCIISPTQPNDLTNKAYVDAQAPLTAYQLFCNYSSTYTTTTPTTYKLLSTNEDYTPSNIPFILTNTTPVLIAGFFNSIATLALGTTIPPGNWVLNVYANVATIADQSHIGLNYTVVGVSAGGVETIIATSASSPLLTVVAPLIGTYTCSITFAQTDISMYSEIGIKIYATSNVGANRTCNIYFQSASYYTSLLTSFATTQASNILTTNNTWTGTNAFNGAVTMNSTLNLTAKATSGVLSLTSTAGLNSGLQIVNSSTNTGNILISQTNSSASLELRNVFGSTGSIILSPSGSGAFLLNSSSITSYLPHTINIVTPTNYTPLVMIDGLSNNRVGFQLNYTAGGLNNLVQAGDNLIWAGSALNTGSLVIGPWTNGSTGIRMSPTGGTTDIQAGTTLTLATAGTTRATINSSGIATANNVSIGGTTLTFTAATQSTITTSANTLNIQSGVGTGININPGTTNALTMTSTLTTANLPITCTTPYKLSYSSLPTYSTDMIGYTYWATSTASNTFTNNTVLNTLILNANTLPPGTYQVNLAYLCTGTWTATGSMYQCASGISTSATTLGGVYSSTNIHSYGNVLAATTVSQQYLWGINAAGVIIIPNTTTSFYYNILIKWTGTATISNVTGGGPNMTWTRIG